MKKPKKIAYRSQSDLMSEAKKVKQMIMQMPTIPKKAGEEYFIVAMDWWDKWKTYTHYDKVQVEQMTPGDGCNNSTTASTVIEDGNDNHMENVDTVNGSLKNNSNSKNNKKNKNKQ